MFARPRPTVLVGASRERSPVLVGASRERSPVLVGGVVGGTREQSR
jgi:hypothetical protein